MKIFKWPEGPFTEDDIADLTITTTEHGEVKGLDALRYLGVEITEESPPVEMVCKHLKPGETSCQMHNLHCSAPACMVPASEMIDGRHHAPQPDGTCSGCNGAFGEFLDHMEKAQERT